MTDYGRDLEFGVSVVPLADPPDWAARIAKAADRSGLDLVGIQDHPYQRRFLDTWTLIATLVPVTERVRFFPDVANLPLRPPAMLAKAAASLDVLSGGRIEMGLGAGAFWDAVVAMDGPRRSPGEAVRSVEEAIQRHEARVERRASLRFDGEFYSLKGMRPGPHPAHDIGLWVGAYGPRMLDLIGRLADGWVPSYGYSPPERLPEMQRRIDEGAEKAGREPTKHSPRLQHLWQYRNGGRRSPRRPCLEMDRNPHRLRSSAGHGHLHLLALRRPRAPDRDFRQRSRARRT